LTVFSLICGAEERKAIPQKPGESGRREAVRQRTQSAEFNLSRHFLCLQIVSATTIIWDMAVATQVKNDTVMSTREAADYLGLAENTVRQYIHRGIISATKIGPVWCVTESECDRYEREKREPGRPISA
jgi:excisionase family DNA binding protein